MLIELQNIPFLAVIDHRALKYFITKRLLNARQAKWADILTDYHFKITYRSGTANVIADALTRKQEDVKTQKDKNIVSRTQVLIEPAKILEYTGEIASLNVENESSASTVAKKWASYELVDHILQANRTHESLQAFRKLTTLSEFKE